jgi:hypothetical protein
MDTLVVFNNEAEWGLQPTRTFKGRNNSHNVCHWIANPVTLRKKDKRLKAKGSR